MFPLLFQVKCYFTTYLKCYCITLDTFPFDILPYIFLLSGHHLNTKVHRKLRALNDIDCVEKCVDDTCCRSANFLKTLDFDEKEDGDNCELFHDGALPAESGSLLRNDTYDYLNLMNPARVSTRA